jgi:hypothetical protein
MSQVIVLDSSPLSLLCKPNPRGDALACQQWEAAHRAVGSRLIIPEICDYEVRRELIRLGRPAPIQLLDDLAARLEYLPLTTAVLRDAALMWATVRQAGLPTAGPAELDCDVILAAQTLGLNDPTVVVATSNVGHLARFVTAQDWRSIPAV